MKYLSKIKKSILLIGILHLYSANANQHHETMKIHVIANSNVSANTMTKAGLRSIFGMRKRTWPEGNHIQVFVLTDNNPTHIHFTKNVLHTFPYNLRRIWDRQIYSGTGQSPTVVTSEEEMRKRVSVTNNAIGYVSEKWVNEKVKILELK